MFNAWLTFTIIVATQWDITSVLVSYANLYAALEKYCQFFDDKALQYGTMHCYHNSLRFVQLFSLNCKYKNMNHTLIRALAGAS